MTQDPVKAWRVIHRTPLRFDDAGAFIGTIHILVKIMDKNLGLYGNYLVDPVQIPGYWSPVNTEKFHLWWMTSLIENEQDF